jgi:nucleoside-diphosphate-sugar epimerase
MNKRILITGGAGFIGFHLAKTLLERNDNVIVTVVDNFSNSVQDKDFQDLQAQYPETLRVMAWDLALARDLPNLQVDEVYHLAAVRGTKFSKHGVSTLHTNILSTLNLIRWFRDEPAKVLFASTGEVWGGLPLQVLDEPVKENSPVGFADVYDPRWTYAASKIAGEIAFIHTPGQWRWSIVRMQNPYGPRMGWDKVVPRFIKHLLEGATALKVDTPWDTRPFTYIDDVVDGLIRVMESPLMDKQIVNVAYPKEIEIFDLAHTLVRVAGTETRVDIPVGLLPQAENRFLDTTKLQSLGWKPIVDLEEGLRRTFEWYQKNNGVSTV